MPTFFHVYKVVRQEFVCLVITDDASYALQKARENDVEWRVVKSVPEEIELRVYSKEGEVLLDVRDLVR
jgi:hypothetical protein